MICYTIQHYCSGPIMKIVSPAQEFLALYKDVNVLFPGSPHDMFLVSLKWIKALQQITEIMFSSYKTFLSSIIQFHLPPSSLLWESREKVTLTWFCRAKTGIVRCLLLLNVVLADIGHSSEGQDIVPISLKQHHFSTPAL